VPAHNVFKQFNQGTQRGYREIKDMIINGKNYQDMQDKYSPGVQGVVQKKT
jgi:PP-loop superfamily ATP-utilizing enzyme